MHVSRWDGYTAQLSALKRIVREVVDAHERQERDELVVLGRVGYPLLHAGYEVLWEVPPSPTRDDLEFLVERDLDAGW